MELVAGTTLADLIPTQGMRVDEILDIGAALGDALGAAHEAGVVHRDLKPGNIMLTLEGRVKILDFGLAKLDRRVDTVRATQVSTELMTAPGSVMGTMPYMSPEQLEGKSVDGRSDIFSLGVILCGRIRYFSPVACLP